MVRVGDIVRHKRHGRYYLCYEKWMGTSPKVIVKRQFDSEGVSHVRRQGFADSYEKVDIPTDMTESEKKAWINMTNKLTQ